MYRPAGQSDIRVNEVHASQAARVLSLALADDPLMRLAMPDARSRVRAMQWYFRRSADCAMRWGQVLSTPGLEAVSISFGPVGTNVSIAGRWRSAFSAAPFRLGLRSMLRLRAYERARNQLHKHCLQQPHTYLFAVGVHPAVQGRGVAGEVIRPTIERAERQGLPCYLETTNDRNLGYFSRFGFEPVLHERLEFAGGQRLNIWSMLRTPHAAPKFFSGRLADTFISPPR